MSAWQMNVHYIYITYVRVTEIKLVIRNPQRINTAAHKEFFNSIESQSTKTLVILQALT